MGLKDVGPEPLEPAPNHYNPSSAENPEHMAKHQARLAERQDRRERARACFDDESFTSIILICDQSDPTALIDRFARHLAPSGKLVVFSKYKEPLLPAFIQTRFSEQPAFIDVSLTESWMRPYQTAAGRLHPEMSLPNSGAGFILSATKVTIL
jgi:tRNA (adenine-N(1)-)-methyltransferase non-catalytic subunit